MLRFGIAAHGFHIVPDARRRAVAALIGVGWGTVDFVQHRVIDICSKCIFDGLEVRAMRVRGDLWTAHDALCAVLYELVGRCSAPVTHVVRPRTAWCQHQSRSTSTSHPSHVALAQESRSLFLAPMNCQISSHCK